MAYHHSQHLHKRRKRSKRILFASFVSVFAALIIAGVIFADWIILRFRNDINVSSSTEASVQSANINIFQTPYFRFQANRTWREVTDQFSAPNEFIYRSLDNRLIEHELWITVGVEKTFAVEKHYPTRIMPIQIGADSRIVQLDKVSEACGKDEEVLKSVDNTGNPQTVSQRNISYLCHPNSTAYNVTIGEPGGSNELQVQMSDGSIVPVTIIYKNVTAYPDARQLEQILTTFRFN